jgi:hypothetical protein
VPEVQQELQNHANALLVDLEEMRKHDGYEEETTIATHILQFTFYVIFSLSKSPGVSIFSENHVLLSPSSSENLF